MRKYGPSIDTTVDAARPEARATRTFLILAVIFLGGCRHAPLVYTLKQEGRTQLLKPPVSKPEIKKARSHPAQKKGCDVEVESFSVAWHGNTARVAVKTETYYAPPAPTAQPSGTPGVAIAESEPRVYVDTMAQLESFREALAAREDSGCFRDDEGAHLREAITERLAFPPQIAAFLRFGTYMRTGFIDLTKGFVIRMVSPAHPDPEVSIYAVAAAPGDNRVRIQFVSGVVHPFAIPDSPAFYRYFYRTGGSLPFLATILGAPDRKTLQDATVQFLSDPTGFCDRPGQGVFCRSVRVGMNAGFYVRINGNTAFVRLGGTLGEALGEDRNGMRLVRGARPVPQNVTVRRMFHGKLIPIKADGPASLLSLVAMPGDEITEGQ